MEKEKEGFVGVSWLHVVQLHTIHIHIVVHAKVRIHLEKPKSWEKNSKILN